jgi:hypothetical protein
MKHLLPISALGLGFLFVGSAIPAHATLVFTSSLAGGDVTTFASPEGPNDPILAYSGFFDTLTVTGEPANNGTYTPLYLNELYDPTHFILTVSGSIAGTNAALSAVTTLVTIDFASGLTANTSGGGFALNFPTNVLSITVSPTLLAYLGASGENYSLTALTDGAYIGGNPGSFTSVGPTMTLSNVASPTPEPTSWILTACGLLAVAFASRQKFAREK